MLPHPTPSSLYAQLPDPTKIRPQPVLEQALAMILQKWRNGEEEYLYMWHQLKSIRQDLRHQGIENQFTVDVYEQHGRIALEMVRTKCALCSPRGSSCALMSTDDEG